MLQLGISEISIPYLEELGAVICRGAKDERGDMNEKLPPR
jgi:hypothetical protein